MNDELTQVFMEELAELLESLEKGLIDLKEAPGDAGLINQVFRDLHTIKGSGAMFGFADLAGFIHDFETAFERVRSGQVAVSDALIRLALAARDQIPALVEGQPDTSGERAQILAQLTDICAPKGAASAPTDTSSAADASMAPNAGPNTGPNAGPSVAGQDGLAGAEPGDLAPAPAPAAGQVLQFQLTGAALALGARPDLLLDELRSLGATQITAQVAGLAELRELTDLETDQCYLAWQAHLPAELGTSDLEDVFLFVDATWQLSPLTDIDTPAPPPALVEAAPPEPAPTAPPKAAAAPAPVQTPTAEPAASIRVPATRLDMLMDSVGELVTVEARLTELARRSRDPALMATSEEVSRLAGRLRDATMSMRMVPLRSLVARFRRLILGLSDDLGKPVDFVVLGEDTELDKTMIEKMADPLVHILRNAIDHGLEPPEARRATQKPARGRIELSAEHAGAEVLVRVRDDGKGINPEIVRAKAIERGLITAEAQLSDAQIFQLVLEPGFSTAETVTELSGRGVGMDVVRRTIDGLRGTIDIDSAPGQGTTVTLRLPLTLAIIEGLLIEVAGELYTVPMAAVKEIIALPREKERFSQSADYLDIRGQFVPFVRLRHLFGCEGASPLSQNVVVVENADTRMGVVVDRIIGTNQTVIKQISKLQAGAREISGATILGDGSVSLIIDVPQLVASVSRSLPQRKEAAA
jgi:two-component system chemotaxis sensor kinase CheA